MAKASKQATAGTPSSGFVSRKFLVAAICMAAGTAIDLYTARGLSQNLLILFITVIGLYTTGNVASKAARRPKHTPAQPGIDPQAIINHVQGLTNTVQTLAQQQAEHAQHLSAAMDEVQKVQSTIATVSKTVSAVMSKVSAPTA